MPKNFSFKILAKDKNSFARTGIIETKNGKIETPYLVPVATRGEVVCLKPEDVKKLKIQCLLANTYHLYFKPGDKLIKKKGGLHKFMNFKGAVFTDSGGFQAFSLGLGRETGARKIGFFPKEKKSNEKEKKFAEITEKGVWFTSVYDDIRHFIGPKESMKIQSNLGADIIMAFDECTSAFSDKEYIKESMERSHKWELESLKHRDKKQVLYGIIHGGWFKDLRLESTKFINKQNFDGIAIGGSLGKTKKDIYEILDWIIPELDERPRHMLGIGWIDDIFECVSRGIDTFDCVEMTRIARHGNLYVSQKSDGNVKNKFRISIDSPKNDTNQKIDKECKCSTCKKYTRKQLRQIAKSKNPEYGRLATIHNVSFMLSLTEKIRESIKQGTFQKLKKQWIN